MTIGAKEGYSHLILAMISPGDSVVVPNPTYPIHYYAPIIAGGEVRSIPLVFDEDDDPQEEFLRRFHQTVKESMPPPKAIVISFPHNPTTVCVERDFFKELVRFCRDKGIWIVHDFAYADIAFDGYKPPSILEIEGARDVAVELYSMSKGFSMAGWRIAFAVGNERIIKNLAHLECPHLRAEARRSDRGFAESRLEGKETKSQHVCVG